MCQRSQRLSLCDRTFEVPCVLSLCDRTFKVPYVLLNGPMYCALLLIDAAFC